MDKKIKFLSDFKPYHDRHVQIMRMVMPGMDDYIKAAESFLRKAVKCCDFCMCMPIEYFEKALKENEIKEMFETGHGATIGGKSTRREAMQQLYSLDSTRYPIKEMPKYGLLVGKNRCADLINDPRCILSLWSGDDYVQKRARYPPHDAHCGFEPSIQRIVAKNSDLCRLPKVY